MSERSTKSLGVVLTLAAACWFESTAVASVTAPIPDCGTGIRRPLASDHPSSKVIDAALAQASMQMGQERYKDAVQTLIPLRCSWADSRVSLLLAAALEGNGDSKGAEETLRQAHSIWPRDNSIGTSLARMYLASGQSEKAAGTLRSSPINAKTPLQELELRVEVYLAVHQFQEAQRAADLAQKAYPSADSIVLFANVLQVEGRSKDVVDLLKQKRTEYANSATFLITLAESEYDTGDWTSARQELADAVALNPESYLAHYLLGNALLKVGDAVAAISEYRSAIALAPEKPRTYVQLAQAMTANNDEAGAEDALKQALVSDSHYAPAHYELGRRLVEQQRFSEAVPYLNAAIKDNPAFETPYYLLAGAYDRMGRKEESRAMRKQFLAVKGANMKRAHSGAGATGLESETKSVR